MFEMLVSVEPILHPLSMMVNKHNELVVDNDALNLK
jgi:hypothetical protein